MNNTQLSLIIQKLTEFYGENYEYFSSKPPAFQQVKNYETSELDAFISDLTHQAAQHKYLLIENFLSPESFKELLSQNSHPFIFWDQTEQGLVPVLAGHSLKDNKPYFWKFQTSSHPVEINTEQTFKPKRCENNPDITKNGMVRFLSTFPLENISTEEPIQELSPLQRLFGLLKNERKDISYIYIYAIVVGIISLTLPLGIQAIIGMISGGLVFSSVYVLVGVVILGIIISGILQIYQQTLVEILQRRVFAKAAFDFTYRIPKIKAEALMKYYAPELMNRFFDILTVQKALPKVLIDITGAVIQILFGIILLALYHPYFIAFGILIVGIVTFVVLQNAPKGLETSLVESKYKYKVAQWLEDLARTVFAFKSAGSTNLPIQKMDYLVNNYLKYRKKHFRVLVILYANAVFFKAFVTGALLIIGTILVVDRQITLGQFVASEIIILLVVGAVEKLIASVEVVFDLLTAVEKMGHVTDLPLEKDRGLQYDFHKTNHGIAIQTKNLSYQYDGSKKQVLKNINFETKANESVCITGTNGSGKETLLKILSAIYTDFEGAISFNGLSIRDINLGSIREAIERNLASDLIFDGTLLENIVLGRDCVKYNDVAWAVEKLNLKENIDQLPDGINTQMTGGGKRFSESFIAKISVARCVVEKPKLLMITDIYPELHKAERMRTIAFLTDKSNPWTLLTISNDPMVMAACDKVVVMDEGRIIMEGSYQELIKQSDFQELVD